MRLFKIIFTKFFYIYHKVASFQMLGAAPCLNGKSSVTPIFLVGGPL